MNARLDACRLRRLLRPGSAGAMALFALSACGIGAARERPDATPSPTTTAAVAPAAEAGTAGAAPPATAATAAEQQTLSPAPGEETTPVGAPPTSAPAATAKMLPPCVPVHQAHAKHSKPKRPPAPHNPVPAELPPQTPPDAVVDAQVGEVGTSLNSILGKDVKGAKGEDLGRVVDVLADVRGHVRVAIIDFGGFLGVGTRRIAVDWPLLRFDPGSRDKPLVLIVDKKKLQSAPEYNSNRPRVLMPPAATDASAADQTKK